MNFSIFTVFLKNRNIIFKMKISKVTDYAALSRVYFDEYILIPGTMFINYFYNLTLTSLNITIADNKFCNNFLHFGYNRT